MGVANTTLKKENIESGFRFANYAPSDTVDISQTTRAIMVNITGDIEVLTPEGKQVTLFGLAIGTMYPFQVKRILSTGTTATNITVIF